MDITLAPGEETCSTYWGGGSCNNWFRFGNAAYPDFQATIHGATNNCDRESRGYLVIKNFGFHYNSVIEGISVGKKEIGTKDFVAKCAGICNGAACNFA